MATETVHRSNLVWDRLTGPYSTLVLSVLARPMNCGIWGVSWWWCYLHIYIAVVVFIALSIIDLVQGKKIVKYYLTQWSRSYISITYSQDNANGPDWNWISLPCVILSTALSVKWKHCFIWCRVLMTRKRDMTSFVWTPKARSESRHWLTRLRACLTGDARVIIIQDNGYWRFQTEVDLSAYRGLPLQQV